MAGGLILPPPPPEVLTCDDILRAGACTGGVVRRLQAVSGRMQVAAAMAPAQLLKIVPKEEHQHILAAIDQSSSGAADTSNGYGYGYGYGDGNGNGDGYGNGYGNGNGNGDGYGYGNGYGNGYGGSSYGEGSYV